MQSALFEPTNLPELEGSGAIVHAVFEDPTLAMVGAGLVGILLFLALRTRGKGGAGFLALGVSLLIAAGLFISSELVVTDREGIADRARALVAAVAIGNEPAMEGLMTETVRVQSKFVSVSGRDRVVELAEKRVVGMVDGWTVPEVRADLPGPRVGRSLVKVKVEGEGMAGTISWWMIQWERPDIQSSAWVASFIEPVWIQGVGGSGS